MLFKKNSAFRQGILIEKIVARLLKNAFLTLYLQILSTPTACIDRLDENCNDSHGFNPSCTKGGGRVLG